MAPVTEQLNQCTGSRPSVSGAEWRVHRLGGLEVLWGVSGSKKSLGSEC